MSVRAGPSLLLEDEVALDREDAAPVREVEHLDQPRVEVELVAILAQPAGDPKAESLGAIGQPERRVEPRGHEAARALGAVFAEAGHGTIETSGLVADRVCGCRHGHSAMPCPPWAWPAGTVPGGTSSAFVAVHERDGDECR